MSLRDLAKPCLPCGSRAEELTLSSPNTNFVIGSQSPRVPDTAPWSTHCCQNQSNISINWASDLSQVRRPLDSSLLLFKDVSGRDGGGQENHKHQGSIRKLLPSPDGPQRPLHNLEEGYWHQPLIQARLRINFSRNVRGSQLTLLGKILKWLCPPLAWSTKKRVTTNKVLKCQSHTNQLYHDVSGSVILLPCMQIYTGEVCWFKGLF